MNLKFRHISIELGDGFKVTIDKQIWSAYYRDTDAERDFRDSLIAEIDETIKDLEEAKKLYLKICDEEGS